MKLTPARVAAALIQDGWVWDVAYLAASIWLGVDINRRSGNQALADICAVRRIPVITKSLQETIERAYRIWQAGAEG